MSNKKQLLIWKSLFFIIQWICLAGCTNDLSDILMRTTRDPVSDKVFVDSMSENLAIHLSWEIDEAVDEYIVERAVDGYAIEFKEVYRGKNLNFTDNNVIPWERYIYRLDKKRGNKTFTGLVSYGFCSEVIKDKWEDNDSKELAVELLEDKSANIYSVSFNDGTVINDEDWYYVAVPGNRMAEVILYDEDFTGDGETVFCWSFEDTNPKQMRQNGLISLKNTSGEAKNIYFKITPVQTGFTESGGSFVRSYQLKLQSISKLGD